MYEILAGNQFLPSNFFLCLANFCVDKLYEIGHRAGVPTGKQTCIEITILILVLIGDVHFVNEVEDILQHKLLGKTYLYRTNIWLKTNWFKIIDLPSPSEPVCVAPSTGD